jgi:hypothetical protein
MPATDGQGRRHLLIIDALLHFLAEGLVTDHELVLAIGCVKGAELLRRPGV